MNPEEIRKVAQTQQESEGQYEHRITVCTAASCLSSGSDKVKAAIDAEVKRLGMEHKCQVKGVGCMGPCSAGPLVRIDTADVLYQEITPEDAPRIMDSLGKEPIKEKVFANDGPFFDRQVKVVLENCGVVDPDSFVDYIGHGGYEALIQALTEMTPQEVLDQVIRSGLRGRGGAGYPTGLKWSTVAKAPGKRKYVVCNGDEGDPGAFMDRSVLESDPYRVLEGMAIAAYAVGADSGYIYVRAEYPLAVKRLRAAIKQAERHNTLGNNICGTQFNFRVEVRLGAGAFVCGEETALLSSIEGHRGQPRPRPPFPAQSGLWGLPTLINNVETFANITPIIRNGGDWFAAIGTEKSKGTKVFALAGKVNLTGLIEVPMGISLRDIIFGIGGGISDGGKFKAVQTGGPSGGCIPEQFLDMPVDYESLAKVGSIMGSGGMIVMDETSSMVDLAKYFMEFCMSESCGKCVPCRVGTEQMYRLLARMAAGEASPRELALLEQLCDMVKHTSLCGLGQTAPNPVVSTLHYFRHEYEERLVDTEGNGHGRKHEKAEVKA
jgi:bidirectional [NiFe] hydrogenase diaphorase subunit